MGATPAQFDDLAAGRYDGFPAGWAAAFRYAEAMTRQGGMVDDETWRALEGEWSPPQLVEITSVIALFNYFNRFANALRIPPTR